MQRCVRRLRRCDRSEHNTLIYTYKGISAPSRSGSSSLFYNARVLQVLRVRIAINLRSQGLDVFGEDAAAAPHQRGTLAHLPDKSRHSGSIA